MVTAISIACLIFSLCFVFLERKENSRLRDLAWKCRSDIEKLRNQDEKEDFFYEIIDKDDALFAVDTMIYRMKSSYR